MRRTGGGGVGRPPLTKHSQGMGDFSPEDVAWVALCLLPRIGGRSLQALLGRFGSAQAVLDAPMQELSALPIIRQESAAAIAAIQPGRVARLMAGWQARGIHLLRWDDPCYPAPLRAIPDPPPLLFARGQAEQNWEKVVAVVGTRQPTRPSLQLAQRLGQALTERGWLVVSGLALGIDAAAHRGALLAGHTLAMLGCGVNNIHPRQHQQLAETILHKGALYCEVSPEALPSPGALMARNRLISGLARATIVVQAGLGSGSLEAARRARQQQRHVFTLDDPGFEGNQALLRQGAIPLVPQLQDWDALAMMLDALPPPPQQMTLF